MQSPKHHRAIEGAEITIVNEERFTISASSNVDTVMRYARSSARRSPSRDHIGVTRPKYETGNIATRRITRQFRHTDNAHAWSTPLSSACQNASPTHVRGRNRSYGCFAHGAIRTAGTRTRIRVQLRIEYGTRRRYRRNDALWKRHGNWLVVLTNAPQPRVDSNAHATRSSTDNLHVIHATVASVVLLAPSTGMAIAQRSQFIMDSRPCHLSNIGGNILCTQHLVRLKRRRVGHGGTCGGIAFRFY